MKKIMTVVLVCMVVVGNTLTASASFKDVALGQKNAQAITFLQDAGVIGGFEDGSFKPAEKLNRAQLMKILVEAQGVTPDPDQYNNCFTDVNNEWFASYVCYAKSVGWVEGLKDGSFKPESSVNKAQAIKMTIESQGFTTTGECKKELFADTDASKWYGKYVCVALEKGLLEEDENGNYVPTNDMTRAQVAENIYRAIMVRKLDKASYTDEVKGMMQEALTSFKTEKEAIKADVDAFKAELKAMKEAGSTDEEIKAFREEFWETVKDAQQANRQAFQGKVKAAHDLFKVNKDDAKEELKTCDDQGMKYSFMENKCVEKPVKNGESYSVLGLTFKSPIALPKMEDIGAIEGTVYSFEVPDEDDKLSFQAIFAVVDDSMRQALNDDRAKILADYKTTYAGNSLPGTSKVERTFFGKTVIGESQETKIPAVKTLESYLIELPDQKLLFLAVRYDGNFASQAEKIVTSIASTLK